MVCFSFFPKQLVCQGSSFLFQLVVGFREPRFVNLLVVGRSPSSFAISFNKNNTVVFVYYKTYWVFIPYYFPYSNAARGRRRPADRWVREPGFGDWLDVGRSPSSFDISFTPNNTVGFCSCKM